MAATPTCVANTCTGFEGVCFSDTALAGEPGCRDELRVLSPLAPDAPVTVDGCEYPSAEHYFQVAKYRVVAPGYVPHLLTAPTPAEARERGRRRRFLAWIDDRLREADTPRDEAVHAAVRTRFKRRRAAFTREHARRAMWRVLVARSVQHPRFAERLVGTYPQRLGAVNMLHPRRRRMWTLHGDNVLGTLLEKLRAQLRQRRDAETGHVGK